MNTFQLVPYLGALPITFQMTLTEVEQVVGATFEVSQNVLGQREEKRPNCTTRYSSVDGQVVEMSLVPGAAIFYDGQDLFQTPRVIEFLARFDQPYEHVGFIVFWNLGIAATGFHDDDDSQKAITVFRAGHWDILRDRFVPYAV